MAYTGDVTVGGPADVHELGAPDHQQDRRRTLRQQRLPAALPGPGTSCWSTPPPRPTRILELDRSGRARADRHHPPARRPLAGARRGGRGDLGHDVRPRPTTPRDPGGDRRAPGRRRHPHGRGRRAGGDPPPRAHPRGRSPCSTTTPTGPPHLFTGDCLFPGGVGKTQTRRTSTRCSRRRRRQLFDRLPDETWVYPGHGGDTTLGAERPPLPSGATAAGRPGRTSVGRRRRHRRRPRATADTELHRCPPSVSRCSPPRRTRRTGTSGGKQRHRPVSPE